ncbi:hypothetical protein ACCD09_32520, partial [Variovorax sp. Varisp62]
APSYPPPNSPPQNPPPPPPGGGGGGPPPTPEANLGDGIFDFPQWRSHGGAWGVGSDSHASVNAAEELLMLEYGQRLSRRQRNVGASAVQPHVAT